MLRRSPSQYRDDCSRPQDARVRAARARRADAPRQVRLGPVAFWIITGTLVILAVWTIITATYFAFREDVLAKLVARHAEMQFALKIASPSCAPRSTAFRAAS
jgi:hypothetical protein